MALEGATQVKTRRHYLLELQNLLDSVKLKVRSFNSLESQRGDEENKKCAILECLVFKCGSTMPSKVIEHRSLHAKSEKNATSYSTGDRSYSFFGQV